MAYKNLIDTTSATVTTATPGAKLDMRHRTTLGRAALGVPVRLFTYATNSNAGESQSIRMLDSTGATVNDLPITSTTPRWYIQDGYLPATDAKYDVHFGGVTMFPTVEAFSLGEYCDDQPNDATATPTLAALTLSATGTFVAGPNNGALDVTLGALTLAATGTNTINGQVGQFLAATTLSATGTFTAASVTYTITKNAGANGTYDAQAYTTDTWAGAVDVYWVAADINDAFIIGISTDNPDASYTGIDRGLICDAGTLWKSEDGTLTSYGAYVANDNFRVSRDGANAITNYKNGVAQGSGTALSGSVIIDSSFRFTNDQATSVQNGTGTGGPSLTWNTVNTAVT